MAQTDSWFDKASSVFNEKIQLFAAGIFMIFTLGMVFAYYCLIINPSKFWLLFLPPFIGLLAYYNRDFAVVVTTLTFVILLL